MSIRIKLILLLSAVFVLIIGLGHLVNGLVIAPSFERLERDEAEQDVHRCLAALDREVQSLSIFLRTWSSWDDAYSYVRDHNEAFVRSNCPPETYTNNNLNLIWIFDDTRKLVWGETRNDTTGAVAELGEFNPSRISAGHALMRHETPDSMVGGLVLTSEGTMLIASRPIVTSRNEGPIRGVMMMGRLFGPDEERRLIEQTRVPIQTWSLRPGVALPPDARQALERLRRRGGIGAIDYNPTPETLIAYSVMNDLDGRPALLIRTDIARKVTASGRHATAIAAGAQVVLAAAILLALWAGLHVALVRPLRRISQHMTHIAECDDLHARLNVARRDEIGTVASAFDAMIHRLAETRASVVKSAHRAGMADVATDVLHNVGNAMNTVNLSADIIAERLAGSKVDGLLNAARLARGDANGPAGFVKNDPRAPLLVKYVCELAETLAAEREASIADVERLNAKLQHISAIIAGQQDRASGPRFREMHKVQDVVADVLAMHAETFAARRIAVDFHPREDLPPIAINRNKLAQVLGNLVVNAIDASPETGAAIVVRIDARTEAYGRVSVSVSDNGCGIEPDDLTRIFSHGFTTKQTGHGFGLHYCANAMTEMGGTIKASSDGVGRGATFTVELPIAPAPAPNAAAVNADASAAASTARSDEEAAT